MTATPREPGVRIEAQHGEPWGVWDRHEHRWVVEPTLADERGAWAERMNVDSRHPWELGIYQAHPETGRAAERCEGCSGTGDGCPCPDCGLCHQCDGHGVWSL